MASALDAFRDELDRVLRFRDRATLVAKQLETEANAKVDEASFWRAKAADGKATRSETRVAAAQAEERETEAAKAGQARLEWENDIDRVYVLRLVTAFEVFLRQFVIEKASGDEALVRRFLLGHDGLRLDPPLHLGSADETKERISACVDETCRTFSSLGTASDYFGKWLEKGFTSASCVAAPLGTQQAKASALADVAILLQLRHILIHKSGVPNAQYHKVLGDRKHTARLDNSMYHTVGTSVIVEPPNAILASPAKYPGNSTKKDDLYQSLLNLAEHIDALYP